MCMQTTLYLSLNESLFCEMWEVCTILALRNFTKVLTKFWQGCSPHDKLKHHVNLCMKRNHTVAPPCNKPIGRPWNGKDLCGSIKNPMPGQIKCSFTFVLTALFHSHAAPSSDRVIQNSNTPLKHRDCQKSSKSCKQRNPQTNFWSSYITRQTSFQPQGLSQKTTAEWPISNAVIRPSKLSTQTQVKQGLLTSWKTCAELILSSKDKTNLCFVIFLGCKVKNW